MADLFKIKQNVAKMASMNAPEEDIDGYLSSEGVSANDIRDININNKNRVIPYDQAKLDQLRSEKLSRVDKVYK